MTEFQADSVCIGPLTAQFRSPSVEVSRCCFASGGTVATCCFFNSAARCSRY